MFGATSRPRRAIAERLEARTHLASTLAHDFSPGNTGSSPSDFVTFNDRAYFLTASGVTGPALWSTDGTDAGTALVKAFGAFPSGSGPSLAPQHLSVAGGEMYFFAYQAGAGYQPWVSDGTPDGTRVLKDGFTGPGSGGGATGHFVGLGDVAVFTARHGALGESTWVTDGTTEGTQRLQGISSEEYFAVSGRRLFITTRGGALYTTDGTEGGTRLLRSFTADVSPARITHLADVGGTLYFSAPTPETGRELWKSDGTPEGTVLVKDLRPGPESSSPSHLANVGGTLFFSASDGAGEALWRSDGTDAGTVKVFERAPGSDVPLGPEWITDFGGVALFVGGDSASGRELWRSDGTAAGTSRVYDLLAGPESGLTGAPNFENAGGRAFFTTNAAVPQAVWVTDGTPAGTRPAADVNPAGRDHVGAGHSTVVGDRLVFAASDTHLGLHPWSTDATPEGTYRLSAVRPLPLSSSFEPLVPFGGDKVLAYVYGDAALYAVDAANNVELLVRDVIPASAPYGSAAGRVAWAQPSDGLVVFAARQRAEPNVVEIWRTDATPAGTFKLADVSVPAFGHMGAPDLVARGGHVYFVASEIRLPRRGAELWRTDGTRAGTTIVRDVAPGFGSGILGSGILGAGASGPALAAAADRVYFFATPTSRPPAQLWETDGTDAGSRPIVDLPGVPGRLTHTGQGLLFTTFTDGVADRLWTSDGTAAGTAPFARPITVIGKIAAFDGAAYFLGSEAGGVPRAIFRSDGTPAGTAPLTAPGAVAAPTEWTVVGGRLYFAWDGKLWRTDGTAGGTVKLLSPPPAPSGRVLQSLTPVGNELYFAASGSERGTTVWKTDGTPEGTREADDAAWGAARLVNVGGTLFFTGYDLAHGTELRRLDTAPRVVARHVFDAPAAPAPGGTAGAPGRTIDTRAAALLPGRTASSANVTNADRGITGVLIDAFGLAPIAAPGAAPTAADVSLERLVGGTWVAGPAPLHVGRGPGPSGAERITLTLPDGAVRNTWLRVTVKANANTGLPSPDVFYFGNLVGDTGGAGGVAPTVNAVDLAVTRANVGRTTAGAIAASDFSRDGRVDAADVMLARGNQRRGLPSFTAPPQPAAAAKSPSSAGLPPAPPARTNARPPRRSPLEAPPGIL